MRNRQLASRRRLRDERERKESGGNIRKRKRSLKVCNNPWAKESADLTEQARIIKTRPDLANFYCLSAFLDEYISQQIRQDEGADKREGLPPLMNQIRELAGEGKRPRQMKTEFHSMEAELDTARWPLDPAVIPNYMGINLCSVEGMSWTRQDDQLVSLTIHFLPA
jgi:hypothetical protein